ncbi:MAG TPA: tetratricopeptide repeat protein [Accumulibacter sp.]|nr:tetratricopeptide repeat protein [Accumulibacter sp.]
MTDEIAITRAAWKTDLTLSVRAEPSLAAQRWVAELLDSEVLALELLASRFRSDSQVSHVNRNAGEWVEVSWDFVTVLTAALDAAAQRIAALPAGEQAAACLAVIDQHAAARGQRLLLLVDNTDYLLHNLKSADHWALRATLQSNPRLLWVGGSYQSLEADSHYHDAFLDFFHVVDLRPLKLNEMEDALLALAETFGGTAARAAMQAQFAAHPERLPTLRQLSGGNPRTTVMLYELFANGREGSVRGDLEALLDNMTPVYKARMEALADAPRKLLAHLLEHWAPISLGELARVSQIANTSISPQLQRLELEGLIEKTRLHGTRRAGYQAAERFFNIWYLMRLSPRRQRNRLIWLVEFMRLWFSKNELSALARQRLGNGSDSRIDSRLDSRLDSRPDSRARAVFDLEFDRSLADALPAEAPERHSLRWSLLKQLRGNPAFAGLLDFDGDDADFQSAADYLQRLDALPALLRACPHAQTEDEKSAWVEAMLASLSLSLAEKERVALDSAKFDRTRYDAFNEFLRTEYSELATEVGQDAAQVVRAAVLRRDFFPDLPDSYLAYQQIRTCFTDQPDALRWVAARFYEKHEDEWCLKAQEFAEQSRPDDAKLAFRRGWLLHACLKRYADAEDAYRQAIARDDQFASPWNNLGNLLKDHLGRYADAEDAYRQAIARDDQFAHPWNGLGNLLQDHLGRYADAEDAYRQAIARDDQLAHPWNNLGNLLQNHLGRYADAEDAYRQAIARDDQLAHPWNNLGNLLQNHLGRYADAEDAYRQAIARDDQDAHPWNNLGSLLQGHLGRYADAEDAYRQAIVRDDRLATPYANLARLLVRQGRPAEAEALYRETAQRAKPDEQNLLLQAHLFLGNRQLAVDALQALALRAQVGEQGAFFRLKEQVWECHEIGLGERLADWMSESGPSVFLQPFAQALYVLAGAEGKLLDLPQESRQLVDEIVRQGRARAAGKTETMSAAVN